MTSERQPMSDRAYRFLLRLLPAAFRGDFGDEMEEIFREQRDEAGRGRGAARLIALGRLWIKTAWGIAREAPRVHVDILLQDVRYSLHNLRRTPGFTATAVLIIGVAMAANASIFSLVNGVLLRPPSFPRPDRLVVVAGHKPQSIWAQLPVSYPNFSDFADRARSFSGLSAYASSADRRLGMTGLGDPVEVRYASCTPTLFRTLGVHAAAGRLFAEGDATQPVIVISHQLAQHLGGLASATGRGLRLDDRVYTVVGVLAADFRFAAVPRPPDVWMPLFVDPAVGQGNRSMRYARGPSFLAVVGRLRDGATLEDADREAAGISASLAAAFPDVNKGWTLTVTSLREQAVRGLRPALLALFGAVAFLLLIACANLASLLLARSHFRRGEIGIRSALGASRLRLIRQFLTESLLISACGAALGLLLAAWVTRLPLLAGFTPSTAFTPYAIPLEHLAPDRVVLAFTAALTLATTVLVGLFPALRQSASDPASALGPGQRLVAGSRRDVLVGRGLVVVEIALSAALLVAAAAFGRSFVRLAGVDPGIDARQVVMGRISLAGTRYPEPVRVDAFYRNVLARLRANPGVTEAGAVEWVPLTSPPQSTDFRIAGALPPPPGQAPMVEYGSATPGYFKAVGLRLVKGRVFREQDDAADARRIILINETMARRYWPGADPVGHRMALSIEALRFGRDGPPTLDFDGAMREIVGVVSDVRQDGLDAEPSPQAYVPLGQRPVRQMVVVVRGAGGAEALAPALRAAVREADADQPVSDIVEMSTLVEGALAQPRLRAMAMGAFALVALLLAAAGVYGVVAYATAQRMREMGVRAALGAMPGQLVRLVVTQASRLVLAGSLAGFTLSLAVDRILGGTVSGTTPAGFLASAALVTFLAVVALGASWLPARRLRRVDPLAVLRVE